MPERQWGMTSSTMTCSSSCGKLSPLHVPSLGFFSKREPHKHIYACFSQTSVPGLIHKRLDFHLLWIRVPIPGPNAIEVKRGDVFSLSGKLEKQSTHWAGLRVISRKDSGLKSSFAYSSSCGMEPSSSSLLNPTASCFWTVHSLPSEQAKEITGQTQQSASLFGNP